jgi:hypothetical protein
VCDLLVTCTRINASLQITNQIKHERKDSLRDSFVHLGKLFVVDNFVEQPASMGHQRILHIFVHWSQFLASHNFLQHQQATIPLSVIILAYTYILTLRMVLELENRVVSG